MSVKKALLIIIMLSTATASFAQSTTLVSIKPLAMIHKALLPNDDVDVLLPTNKNLHDYALTVSDMRVLQQAKVFFWLGDHNERFIHKLEKRFAGDASWHALAANSDHIWLDPNQQSQLIQAMARVLSTHYPEQKAQIEHNQKQLVQSLLEWKLRWTMQLLPYQGTAFLLGHDAFLPFAKGLGLKAAVMYRSGHSHGHVHSGAQTLTAIQQRIAANEIRCAIEEPDVSFAQLAGRYPQLKRYTLQPAGGDIPLDEKAYLIFLEASAQQLYQCLKAE